ncbi:MAG: oligosaccharide flippase family protein [Colwellia sp.]|nr:oligosaccharide flippase family protein [Colwellia sp.]
MTQRNKIIQSLCSTLSVDLLNLLIPLVTLPVLTRAIGIELYGQYLLFIAVATFLTTVLDFGTNYMGVRLVNNVTRSKVKIKIFSEFQFIRLVILFILLALFSLSIPIFETEKDIVLLLAVYLIGSYLMADWYYFAFKKIKLYGILQVVLKVSSLVYIVYFIDSNSDFYTLLMVTALIQLIGGLISVSLRIKQVKLVVLLNKRGIIRVRQTWFAFISVLMPNLYNSLPFIYVGNNYSTTTFGFYAIAYRLSSIAITLQNTITKTLFPFIESNNESKINLLLCLNLMVAIPSVIIIFVFGQELVYFITGESIVETVYLKLLIISSIFIGVTNSLMAAHYFPLGKSKLFGNITTTVALVSIIPTTLLINYSGILGGCLSLFLARALMMFTSLFYSTKLVKS